MDLEIFLDLDIRVSQVLFSIQY